MLLDFHNAWEATDNNGYPLSNGKVYDTQNKDHFVGKFGYKDIYPPSNLTLYVLREDNLETLHFISHELAEEDGGKFTLFVDVNV